MEDNARPRWGGMTPGSKEVWNDTITSSSIRTHTHTHTLSRSVSGKATIHTNRNSRFHSSLNSSELTHQPVTCCAGNKQELNDESRNSISRQQLSRRQVTHFAALILWKSRRESLAFFSSPACGQTRHDCRTRSRIASQGHSRLIFTGIRQWLRVGDQKRFHGASRENTWVRRNSQNALFFVLPLTFTSDGVRAMATRLLKNCIFEELQHRVTWKLWAS